MATSIDESFIKGALEYQQSRFFQTLPPELSATSRQQRWVAYILSLSQSSTPSGTNSLIPTTASGPVEHAPPLPAVVPDAKRRRLNSDTSQHARRVSLSRQHSLPSHSSRYQDGPSPLINTGPRVPTPALSQWYNSSIPKQPQAAPQTLQPLAIPQRQASTSKRTQTIPVREYNPGHLGPSFQAAPANPYCTDQMYNHSSTTLQTSLFPNASPQSSSSGISLGVSTTPTSMGSSDMTREDSSGGASFYKGLEMIRLNSAVSKATTDQNDFRKDSPTGTQQTPDLKPPQVFAPSADPAYDISLAGAQFSNHHVDAAAPIMQRQMSSCSRQLQPKPNVNHPMTREPSSADGHDVIRVPSSDGSYKEAIKISPASSFTRSSSSKKVECSHPGCISQLQGFKGMHEMQRHFDRAHKKARQVYVCAPLEDEPEFLSKPNCKGCQNQKRYNEDYNAGEHLRRMHFNPKPPKVRRGQLKPEEKRGGKGGGTEPSMTILRNYMVTFEVDVNGKRVSEPRRVNPSSNLIMPTITDGSDRPTDEDSAKAASPTCPAETDLEHSNAEAKSNAPWFAGNELPGFDPAQFDFAVDLNNPLIDDPPLFDANLLDNSAVYDDELAGLFPFLP